MKRWAVVLLVLLLVAGAFLFGPRLLRAVGADLGGFSGGGDYGGGDSGWSGGSDWGSGTFSWGSDDDDGGDARHEEVLAEIRGFVFGGQLHENAQLRRAGVLWGGGERVDRLALRVSEPVGVRHGALLTAAPVPRNAQNTMFRLHYLNA